MIRIKNQEQVKGIRKSCALLGETFGALKGLVTQGITARQIDQFARQFIEERGGRPAFLGYGGFPGAVCTSVNEQVIHGIPGDRALAAGDIVGCDIGIDLDGYYSDAAFTFAVGEPPREVKELMRVTRKALFAGIGAARKGNRIKDISRAVEGVVKPHGYGIVKEYCGHGVGLDVHEDPQIPNYVSSGANPRLKKGMVIALEPMINLGTDEVEVLDDQWTVVTMDRKVSAHFEHTIYIGDEGPEILTAMPFEDEEGIQ